MARYLAMRDATKWNKIPEKAGNIKVYAGGTSPHWYDIKQVDVFTGDHWTTMWRLPAAEVVHTTKPPVHVTTYHTVTIHPSRVANAFRWTIPTGRHVTRMSITIYRGATTGGSSHRYTLAANRRNYTSSLSHIISATVTYTYY